MADENKAPELDETTSAEAGESTAIPDATGDDGQQTLELPATEGEADPKPEAAAGEPLPAGNEASAATDAPAVENDEGPTPAAPADLEDHGTSDALTLAAADSSDAPADDSTSAGAEQEAPETPLTPVDGAPEAQPEVGIPEADEEPSVSTGIGGDKAAEVTPPEAPKLEQEKPAATPAPSMFNSGTPINLPDMSIATEDGYPVAQDGVPPVHPQHFGTLLNDGVGDDAGKVVDGPRYPVPADAVTVVDGGKEDSEGSEGDKGEEPAPGESEDDEAGVPSAIPPHVESKLSKLAEKIDAIADKVDKLLHELLD